MIEISYMRTFLSKNLIFLAIFFSFTTFGFGRYVGTLTHDKINQEQLAKLDFIVSRDEGSNLELNAVLTLYFGDFTSSEYTSYHFSKIRFNVLSGTLVFDEATQPISLITTKFSRETGEFEADLRAIWSGNVGKLKLKKDGVAEPRLPIIQPVWGEYQGFCGGRKQTLQLYTWKSAEDLGHLAQPFSAVSIGGQMGAVYSDLQACNSDNGCSFLKIISGAYNFFSQDLDLIGHTGNLSCKVVDKGLTCDGCVYKRISNEIKTPLVLKPQSAPIAFPKFSKSVPVSSGEYKGYLHHEYLNAYQIGILNLAYFQVGGSGGLKISANAKLYFGDESSREVIPYRFLEKNYPNPLVGEQVIVLENAESDTDAIIQITSSEEGVIRGVWYSLIFGRVGTFEFKKSGLPELPLGSHILKPISADYESTDWVISIKTAPGTKPPVSTSNPFFPNIFSGGVWLKSGATPRLRILNGSYDFYTGHLGIQRESAKGESTFAGRKSLKGGLFLNTTTVGSLTPLPFHSPIGFRKIPD